MKKIGLMMIGVLIATVAVAQPGPQNRNPDPNGTRLLGPNTSSSSSPPWIQTVGPPLWDNGLPDAANGYSNAADGILGAGITRSILVDFVVPPGETWDVDSITWRHVWGTPPGGPVGTGVELRIVGDAAGPDLGTVIGTATVMSYMEVPTGGVFFSRNEQESFADFTSAISVPSGTYWVEANIVGPENNFWLTSANNNGTACWVNYSDLGFEDCLAQFGADNDLNLSLGGTSMIPAELTGFEVE